MIQVGFNKIKEIYVGSDRIEEVYYGSEKVWEGVRGYWVHKDTGVKTYFTLGDTPRTDGMMDPPSWRTDCSEVRIPFGISGLGANCFYSCTSLTSITLPEGIFSLGQSCFYQCTSLTSITLPKSVSSLGEQCFRLCSSLTSITLPESVTSIGRNCFNGCTSLILATVLPATPPSLSASVFLNTPTSLNIKVRAPYVNAYKTATNWKNYADKISAI